MRGKWNHVGEAFVVAVPLGAIIFLLVTWVRWSFVRIRVDQILALSWKALLPATLALLLATAVVVVWRTNGGV